MHTKCFVLSPTIHFKNYLNIPFPRATQWVRNSSLKCGSHPGPLSTGAVGYPPQPLPLTGKPGGNLTGHVSQCCQPVICIHFYVNTSRTPALFRFTS